MSGTLGHVEEFNGAQEKTGRSTLSGSGTFFVANGIESAKKKHVVLLSVIGASTYKTLRNLVSP